MRLLRYFALFVLLVGASAQAKDADGSTDASRQRNPILKTDLYGWVIGSANVEAEVVINESLSVYVPFHYTDRRMSAVPKSLFFTTSMGFSVGGKIHFYPPVLRGFYGAFDAGVMVAYFNETVRSPRSELHSVYRDLFPNMPRSGEVYDTHSEVNLGPFWIPVQGFRAGYDYLHEDTGVFFDVSAGISLYHFSVVYPEVKLSLGYAF